MAIALDTSTYGSFVGSGTSLTWSHTCTGSDLVLFVGVIANDTTDLVTGVTYNGVAMTLVGKENATTDRWTSLYVLAGPATGTHSVVVSTSSACYITGLSTSYTGGHQTTPIDSHVEAVAGSASSLTATTTVVASGCWLVGMGRSNISPVDAGTGTTERAQETDFNSGGLCDSNGTVGTGSQSLQITFGGSGQGTFVVASLAPAASGDVTLTPGVGAVGMTGRALSALVAMANDARIVIQKA